MESKETPTGPRVSTLFYDSGGEKEEEEIERKRVRGREKERESCCSQCRSFLVHRPSARIARPDIIINIETRTGN